MKFYLYGIQGVYNYGCEAMVRGISARLAEMYPECKVIYKTPSPEKDSAALADCDTVTVSPVEKKVFTGKQKNIFYRGVRFLKKKLHIAATDDYIHINTDWTRDCDVLVVIGGDVFDLNPSMQGKPYRNDRILLSKMVKENGGKVILWGISVGSFEKDLGAKRVLIDYFKHTVDLAVIRDKKSFDYLRDSGVNERILLYSDPAYMLRTVQASESKPAEKVLGINLSPLSNRYLEGERTEDAWICAWADAVEKIYRQFGFEKLLLIPHVVTNAYARDDDLSYLAHLKDVLDKRGVPTELVEDDAGFLGVKKHLVRCSLLLSARMHCSVNAITCGVPTVFLSYSPKSIGMCRHVYGDERMYFDMNEVVNATENVIPRLEGIMKALPEIASYLEEKNQALYRDALLAAKAVEHFLKANK